jgi:acetyltransferase
MNFDIGVHDGRRLRARPLVPDDRDGLIEMARRSTPEDLRLRFFSMVKLVDGPLLERLTHIDPEAEVALVVFDPASADGGTEILGVVRLHHGKGGSVGELAVIVRSDLKGRGIGHDLMSLILKLAAERGLTRVIGDVLSENRTMLQLVRDLGGRIESRGPAPGITRVSFDVRPSDQARRPTP